MPSDKRARQRAGRQARLAEQQRAYKNRRRNRRVIPALAAGVLVIALLVAYTVTKGSSTKKVTTKAPTTTVPVGPSTAAATPASLAALTARPAPAAGAAACTAAPAPPTSATTVPAKGNAVSMVNAPAGVGFPAADGTSPRYTHFAGPPPFCIDPAKTYTAKMVTDLGTITISLYPKDAPVTVNNFVFLAGYHYFDGTVFHRVIPGFVDQGGDPTGTGTGGPGYAFADELPKSPAAYDDGALAMANSGPNTNGSQFFLVVDTGGSQLSPAYTDFGQITSGLDVAKRINNDGDATDNGSPPKVTHRILSVTVSSS